MLHITQNPLPECLVKSSPFSKHFPKPSMLNMIRKKIIKFSALFLKTFRDHLNSEYEVQIRNGQRTVEASLILDKLEQDSVVLKYKENIKYIFKDFHTKGSFGHLNHSSLSDLLDVAEDDILKWFDENIKVVQKSALKYRRRKNSLLCSAKCSKGPQIYNFSPIEISPDLKRLLENGLKNVPALGVPSKELLESLEHEVIEAARNLFFSYLGHYPIKSRKITFDASISEVLSQCPCNSELVNQLVVLRDNFVEMVPFFLTHSTHLGKTSAKATSLLKLVPEDCIITQSDKQVGISILPHSWYEKEYQNQIVKGGHELVSMSEGQCLASLHKKISEFKSSCTEVQKKTLLQYWPRVRVDNYRIGVLKLVPKV